MKIAVIGVYYASNLGDAIICDCVHFWLKEKWPLAEIDVIDIENKKGFAEQTDTSMKMLQYRNCKLQWDYWLTKHKIQDRVYYWNKVDVETRQEFYDEIAGRNYDMVVFAGGQMFMDWLSVDIVEFLKRLEKNGTPVYFNACGAGMNVSAAIRKLMRYHLMQDNVKLISSRDACEKIEKLYLRPGKQVIKTYDPALWTSDVYPVNRDTSSQIVGLGVMYSNHAPIRKITRFWIRLIRKLDKKGIKWKMFCNGAIDDYNYAAYILKKIGLKKEEYLIDCPHNPIELVKQITSFKSIISFRLHSHIVSASYHIPAVAIVWDDKLRFFYRSMGHEERCKTVDDSADVIIEALRMAEQEGYDVELLEKQKTYARNLLLNALLEGNTIE